jgi:hypothetical protein
MLRCYRAAGCRGDTISDSQSRPLPAADQFGEVRLSNANVLRKFLALNTINHEPQRQRMRPVH